MAKERSKLIRYVQESRWHRWLTAKHASRRRIVLCIALALILLFIFGQSALPEQASAEESGWIRAHIMTPLFGLFGLQPPSHNLVRKLAHVFEYTVLAALSVFYFRDKLFKSCSIGFLIAFLDESFQLLTGRGALISDVWIDLIGIALGTVLGFLLRRAILKRNASQHTN